MSTLLLNNYKGVTLRKRRNYDKFISQFICLLYIFFTLFFHFFSFKQISLFTTILWLTTIFINNNQYYRQRISDVSSPTNDSIFHYSCRFRQFKSHYSLNQLQILSLSLSLFLSQYLSSSIGYSLEYMVSIWSQYEVVRRIAETFDMLSVLIDALKKIRNLSLTILICDCLRDWKDYFPAIIFIMKYI